MSKRKSSAIQLPPVKRRSTTTGGLVKSHTFIYDDDPWQNLFDMYDQAISKKDYQEVTRSATTAIDHLTDDFVKLFDLRARALSYGKEFNQALNDGFKMINESPTCAMGYIRTGHIYGLQGNLVKALEVLLRGLSLVASNDPQYPTLQRDASEAEDCMSHHIAALALEAKFDIGLRIAWDLISVHPFSSTGYLCAGNLHMMQGRVQTAIEMFQIGLKQVPESDSNCPVLMDKLQEATQIYDKRLDILSTLPFELTSYAFSHLSMPELTVCMDVSKSWKSRVLQCTEAWRRLAVSRKYEMSLVTTVGEHIRHLEIDARSESTDICLQLISDRKICNLETLEIDTVFRQAPTVRRFFSAFRETGPTLQKLNLKFGRANPRPPPLIPILNMCPQLAHFTYHTWNVRRQDVRGARPNKKFVLTHLDLFTHRSIGSPELEAILRHCPKLSCLVLYKCSLDCLRLIPRYCSSIEYFSLNKSNIIKGRHWEQIADLNNNNNNNNSLQQLQGQQKNRPSTNPMQHEQEKSKGLRSLSIYTSDIIGPHGAVEFINSNKDTVKELALGIGDGDQSFTTLIRPWASLVLFEWNYQLRKIELSLDRCRTSILRTMMGRCPNLEAIKLDRTGSLEDDIFDTLVDLEKLYHLELAGGTNTRITDEGLATFFDEVADKNRLRIICFSDLSPVKNSTLIALAKLKSLQKLTIRRCQGVVEQAMDQFADTLAKSSTPSLQEITFHSMATITNSALARMGEVKSLTDMTIIRCSRIDEEGIQELLNRWKTFKRLYIHGYSRNPHKTTYYCHGRVPQAFKSLNQEANNVEYSDYILGLKN